MTVREPPITPADRSTLPGVPPRALPRPYWVLYVDLDAFYVSCELRDRPELRGRPVLVGPPPAEGPTRGVVLSASYEARPSGVRSAMPVAVAARLCPDAVWIPPDFAKYERNSKEVRAILRRHSPTVIPYSIDEAAVVVRDVDAAAAHRIATQIQQELLEEMQLPASVGVAASRAIAKIAVDRAKPAGIRVVPAEEAAAFLAPLPVRAIPGVGPKTEELLHGLGIQTIGDLAARKGSELARPLGSFGAELIALARGEPHEEPEVADEPRSRSTDHTFARDVDRWDEIEATVRSLAGDLAGTLDHENLRYGTVGVAYRWADFTRSQRSRSLGAAREGPLPLTETAVRLARELWEVERSSRQRPIRTVSVRTERLLPRTQKQVFLDEFR
ncbi:MAG TPA: DNA polymerase IV [Thermoplasmata archaeon]|nr:DNA polymerase IV [Thermoplasmata archaeon]